MEKFIKLKVLTKEDGVVERYFNLRYIRHVEENTLSVMLNGSQRAMKISEESMQRLVDLLNDTGEREHRVFVSNAEALAGSEKREPWYKRLF